MSRRREIDVAVRHRLGSMLPAMFHDDDMAQRWCDGLDDLVAPVPATLDSFWAYLDPMIAPVDFVDWLAGWVGLELDQTWDEARRRELVLRAHRLYDARGTAHGLSGLVELYTGVTPDIVDSGGVAWSASPGEPLPGTDANTVTVRLAVPDPGAVDERRIDELVGSSKPAHVFHRLEIVAMRESGRDDETTDDETTDDDPSTGSAEEPDAETDQDE